MNEIEVVKVAVSKMTGRSVSIVATEIATAQDRKKRHALLLELDEARRRVRLEETLLNLTHNSQAIRFSESEDPFVHKIALLLSSSDSNVSIIFNLCIALFLELAGVILWLEYSHDKEEEPETGGEILCSGDITTSQNKPTVEQIRLFLRCGQEKAMEVHRLTAGLRRKNGNRVIG
jgi:hypothetical protein